MSLADLDTPSGFSSALEPSQISGTEEAASALPYSVPSDVTVGGSNDMLSSTMRDDAASSSIGNIDISAIQIQEIFFCSKCGEVFQS